jgi:hypothetical protein
MPKVTGTFEVKLAPLPLHELTDATLLGRMSIDKRFSGGIEGTGKGEMLSARTATANSAGYVAIELVAATIGGRSGGFVLQHSGTMNRGEQSLSCTVVPDSGTGALTGITGKLGIRIESGKHYYDFEYSLSTPP